MPQDRCWLIFSISHFWNLTGSCLLFFLCLYDNIIRPYIICVLPILLQKKHITQKKKLPLDLTLPWIFHFKYIPGDLPKVIKKVRSMS